MSEIQLDKITIKTQAEAYIHYDKLAKTFNEMKKNYHLIKDTNANLNSELKNLKDKNPQLGNLSDIQFYRRKGDEISNQEDYTYTLRIGSHSMSHRMRDEIMYNSTSKYDIQHRLCYDFEYQIDSFLKSIKDKAMNEIMKVMSTND